MFRKKEDEITVAKQRLKAIEELLNAIMDEKYAQSGIFDSEDFEVTKKLYQKRQQELQALEADYMKRRSYYETQLLQMKKVLELRQSVLESVDRANGILNQEEELRKYYVDKQVLLTQCYKESGSQLSH